MIVRPAAEPRHSKLWLLYQHEHRQARWPGRRRRLGVPVAKMQRQAKPRLQTGEAYKRM